MTYQEAIAELTRRYRSGERDIRVPREMYLAYSKGLLTCDRYVLPPRLDDYVCFKAAKVRVMEMT